MGQQRYIIQGLDENVSFLQEIKALLFNGDFMGMYFLAAYVERNLLGIKKLLKLKVELYTINTVKIALALIEGRGKREIMERNLLLGNGINAHLHISGLNTNDIANRFSTCLIRSNVFFDLMFGVHFTLELCQELYSKTEKRGIESLATIVYDYVTDKIKAISINDRMRVLDAIICCAITSIFYDGNRKLGDDLKRENLPDFSKFSHVYTLNYVEFWDETQKCIYLHGKYNLNNVIDSDKDVLHYSLERNKGYKGYSALVEKLKNRFNMCELYTRDIVFSPEFHRKSEMMAMGSYPSEHLYPAEDLFLHQLKPLYEELNCINEIEIFGMSPYGDDDIIKKLNSMKKVVVYVYNYKNNIETQIWDQILTCPHEIRNSMDIMI